LNAVVKADEPSHLGRIPRGDTRIARIARDGEAGKLAIKLWRVHNLPLKKIRIQPI
jgi:hypothetical protein